MEPLTLLITIILLSLTFILLCRRSKLPPGPIGLPLVGSLPFLDPPLHTYFTKLAQKYGPIFSIRLGSKLAVVISSPSVVKAFFNDHDINFCNRDILAAARVLSYGLNDIVWTPYGPTWRMLRCVILHEVLSPLTHNAVVNLREREFGSTVHHIHAKTSNPVDIGATMSFTILNVITSTMWGRTFDSIEERESVCEKVKVIVDEIINLFERPNFSDFFPVLARFDLQGVERKIEVLVERLDRIFEDIIEKRHAQVEEKENDFLGFMLKLEKEGGDNKTSFTRTHVKAILMV
ncbi:hypothetical protein LUZ60_000553 [Juncus effusus]|nr:hypothetical protein LUZ60_000553 [Juncus effusus]